MQKMLGVVVAILVTIVVLFTIGAGMSKTQGTKVSTDADTEINKLTNLSPTVVLP